MECITYSLIFPLITQASQHAEWKMYLLIFNLENEENSIHYVIIHFEIKIELKFMLCEEV